MGKAMSAETRMAMEQSIAMPPFSESGMSVRRSSLLLRLSNYLVVRAAVLAELPVLSLQARLMNLVTEYIS